jgi:4-amino-4-deoxy-L-arabinose transferase-like glycosyltransferase
LTEREWREASDLRPSRFGLAAVLIVAAVLRFWALGHGIPFSLGVDEPEIMERAVNMVKSGDFNPRFFDYPSLYIYAQFAVAVVRFVAGALAGTWHSLGAAPTAEFYLWGRALTALLGVATVVIVYQAGMRWGARHALLAAGLMAVQPQHVRESHYVLTDVPLTFFVALTLLLSLRAAEHPTLRAFAWAGAAAGLAMATKYNGALALLLPLVACWMSPGLRPSRLAGTLAAAGAAAGAFLIGAPYSVLDLPTFLDAFARLSNEYRGSARPLEAVWLTYLKHLRGGFGYPALLLAGAGVALGVFRLVRGPGRARWALIVSFPLVYFLMISNQRIAYARYLLPLVPSLCVLAATAVVSGVSLLRRYEIPRAPRTALITGLTIAALLPPAVGAVKWDRDMARRGTVEHAYEWILANLPEKSVVMIESRSILLPGDRFKADHIAQLRHRPYEHYRDNAIDYLIASSQCYGPYFAAPERFPHEYADYRRIFDQSRELVRFTPSDRSPGPELRILKVRP